MIYKTEIGNSERNYLESRILKHNILTREDEVEIFKELEDKYRHVLAYIAEMPLGRQIVLESLEKKGSDEDYNPVREQHEETKTLLKKIRRKQGETKKAYCQELSKLSLPDDSPVIFSMEDIADIRNKFLIRTLLKTKEGENLLYDAAIDISGEHSERCHQLNGIYSQRKEISKIEFMELLEEFYYGDHEHQLLKSEDLATIIHRKDARNLGDEIDSLYQLEKEIRTKRNEIVSYNLRMVKLIAKYQEDHFSVGNIGLIRAIEKFDYRRKNKFSTLATWWIIYEINRYKQNHKKDVRIPVHIQNKINEIIKTKDKLIKKNGEEPTTLDIAKEFARDYILEKLKEKCGELSPEFSLTEISNHIFAKRREIKFNEGNNKITLTQDNFNDYWGRKTDEIELELAYILETGRSEHQLDAPIYDNEKSYSYKDLLKDDLSEKLFSEVENRSSRDQLDKILSTTLNFREKDIIEKRFGLVPYEKKEGTPDKNRETKRNWNYKTLEEIAIEYELTRERIRQIEAVALKKLKIKAKKYPILRKLLEEIIFDK